MVDLYERLRVWHTPVSTVTGSHTSMLYLYQGQYRGDERRLAEIEWRNLLIPSLLADEIAPLNQFFRAKQSITAIDGGSNKGFWSKALLNYLGDKVSHIYLIDPSPENYSELLNNIDNMVFDKVDFNRFTAINCAITSKIGIAPMYTNRDGSPIGSLFSHKVGEEHTLSSMGCLTDIIQVKCNTIDNIINEYSISHVDILKLDLEGSEFEALLGAQRSIAEGKIDIIVFEFGLHQVDARNFFRDFYQFFRDRGYALFKIIPPDLHPVPEYSYHQENFTSIWNFAAVNIDPQAQRGGSAGFQSA